MHYGQMRTAGLLPARRTPAERFWAKVNKDGPCWIWTAQRCRGYGWFRFESGRQGPAHRWSYADRYGPIPEGMEIDHLCRVLACVNPAHLEAVTPKVNKLRGIGAPAMHARKTHCVHGHAITDPTTYYVRQYNGGQARVCKKCATASHARWRAKRRALGLAPK